MHMRVTKAESCLGNFQVRQAEAFLVMYLTIFLKLHSRLKYKVKKTSLTF